MRSIKFFYLAVLLVVGCAPNGYLAKDRALTNPSDGFSIPHPVEIEKSQIKAFTSFMVPMNPDLWTEVVAGGGVWPIEGYAGEEKVRGYCYLNGLNYIGDFINQCVIAKPKIELEKFKFLIYNRDANWAYRLDGQEAREILSEQEIKDGKKPLVYDAKEFNENSSYQKEFVAKFGQTLDEAISVSEIIVGSPEWEKYCAEVNARFPEKYKMANGEIRIGTLALDDFKRNAVEEPGFDSSSRFVDRLRLPLYLVPFTVASYPIVVGASLANTAVATGVDRSWKGYYGRAQIIRYQMAPTFHFITFEYKKLIKFHIDREKELEDRLRQSWSNLPTLNWRGN